MNGQAVLPYADIMVEVKDEEFGKHTSKNPQIVVWMINLKEELKKTTSTCWY